MYENYVIHKTHLAVDHLSKKLSLGFNTSVCLTLLTNISHFTTKKCVEISDLSQYTQHMKQETISKGLFLKNGMACNTYFIFFKVITLFKTIFF